MSLGFLTKVKSRYDGLSKTEKKIADYLMDHQSEARNASIQDLSKTIDISMSAISRFAKKAGFTSYKDMQLNMSEDKAGLTKPFFSTIDQDASMVDIAHSLFYEGNIALASTYSCLNEALLHKTIDLLARSNRCGIFGLGASSVLALSMYHRFIRTTLSCVYVADYHLMTMNAGTLNSDDCAVIISHTGKNKDILRIIDILGNQHVPIVLITSNAASPAAKKTDIILTSVSEEIKFRPEAVTSIISQMMLIDTLFTLYAIKIDHDEKLMANMRAVINTTRLDG